MSITEASPKIKDDKRTYYALFDIKEELFQRLEFESEDDQTVYISAYTEGSVQRYPECSQKSDFSYLNFTHDRAYQVVSPLDEYFHLEPLEMKAGEKLGATI